MKKTKLSVRILSGILAAALLAGMLPFSAFAEEAESAAEAEQPAAADVREEEQPETPAAEEPAAEELPDEELPGEEPQPEEEVAAQLKGDTKNLTLRVGETVRLNSQGYNDKWWNNGDSFIELIYQNGAVYAKALAVPDGGRTVEVTQTHKKESVGSSKTVTNYYWITIKPARTEITVTIQGDAQTVTYDGKQHTASGWSIVSAVKADGTAVDYSAKNISVDKNVKTEVNATRPGSYYANLTADSFKNTNDDYVVTFVLQNDISLIIEKAKLTITITGKNATVRYDGRPHMVMGADVEVSDESLYDARKLQASGDTMAYTGMHTNIGTYYMGLSKDNFRYNDPYVDATIIVIDGWLKIGDPITVHVKGKTQTVTYNGSEQTFEGWEFVKAENPDGSTAEYSASNITLKSGAAASVSGTNVGSYYMHLSADSFADTSGNIVTFVVDSDGCLTIDQARITVKVTGKSDDTAVYNGSEQSVSGYTLSCSDTVVYDERKVAGPAQTAAAVSGTDAGTYTMSLPKTLFAYDDPNVDADFEVTPGTLTISPAEVAVAVDDKSKTYGDTDPEFTATVSGLVDGDTLALTYAREPGEAVGSYAITATAGENKNYTVTSCTPGTLTIGQGTMTVSVESAEKTYDGSALASNAVQLSVTEGTTVTYSVDGGEYTADAPSIGPDAGKATVSVKAVNANYGEANCTYTLEIKPKAATVAADAKSKTYGEDDPILTATVSGNVDGETLNYTLARAAGEDAGTYDITVTLGENPNYTITCVPADFTITKAEFTVNATGEQVTETYDGATTFAASKVTFASDSKLFNESLVSYTAKKAESKNAVTQQAIGYTAADFSYGDTDNVTVTFNVTDGWLTVNKAVFAVNATGEQVTETYDGTTTFAAMKITFASDSKLFNESLVSYTAKKAESKNAVTQQAIGYTAADFSYSDTDNVTVTFNVTDGWLTVSKAKIAVSVTGNTATKTYNGKEQSVEGYTAESDSTFFSADKVKYSGEAAAKGTKVGEYPMNLTAESFSYEDGNIEAAFTVAADGKLTIKAKPAAVVDDETTPTTVPTPAPAAATTPARAAAPAAAVDADGTDTEPAPTEAPTATPAPADASDDTGDSGEGEEIDEAETPEAAAPASWALINVLCALLTAVMGIMMLAGYFGKKKNAAGLLGIVPAAVSVIAVVLTQDFGGVMGMTDKWTLLMAVLVLVQLGVSFFTKKSKEDAEEA